LTDSLFADFSYRKGIDGIYVLLLCN